MDRSVFAFTTSIERRPLGIQTPKPLPGWELRVRDGRGEVGGRSHGCEPDDRAVDVDSCGAVRSGLAGGRVDTRQQVGPGSRQAEDDVLIDLPRVESLVAGLLRPPAEVRMPPWAVGVGIPMR